MLASKLTEVFATTKNVVMADLEAQLEKQRAKLEADTPSRAFLNQFEEKLLKFFSDEPEINTVFWTMKTNEWNDGEACHYEVKWGEVFGSRETITDEQRFKDLFDNHYPGDGEGIFSSSFRDDLPTFLEKQKAYVRALFGEADVGITRNGTIFVTYHDRQNIPQGASDPYGSDSYGED
jgi:hypothetical protein